MDISSWLMPHVLEKHYRGSLRTTFEKNKPFPHIFIPKLLHENKAKILAKALANEKFEKKQSDLFSLSQTQDFIGFKHNELKEFYELFCSKEFAELMQEVTGVKLKKGVVDMAGSLYEDCDYLLCHDDQLEGRKLAYIYYLSESFTERDGGALALLEDRNGKPGKVIVRYPPNWNSFMVFSVGPESWHEVEEILADKKRYAIGGWLH